MCRQQMARRNPHSLLSLPNKSFMTEVSNAMASPALQASDIAPQIAHDGALITDFLADYFEDMTTPATQLVSAMRYASLNGGKRIRSALCLSAARLAAPQDEAAFQRAIIAAAALEMVHAYSLVHDDLPAMDDAEMRRGKPSTHIAFNEETAILAGDALQTEAFALLSAPHETMTAEIALALVAELAHGSSAAGMAGGQMLDLQAEGAAANGQAFDAAQTEQMQAMKTGALIIAAPVMGALATGKADAALLANLRGFAAPLGLAFQVADDVLDVTADTDAMGKPVGRDKDQGKASFVDFYGLEGARAYAAELVAKSVAHLDSYGKAAHPLTHIAQFVINRSH